MNQPSLFGDEALARPTDPNPSHEAARSQKPTLCETDILWKLQTEGPMYGDQLAGWFLWRNDGTVKTALSRCIKRGDAEWTGEEITPEGHSAAQGVARITYQGARRIGALPTETVVDRQGRI